MTVCSASGRLPRAIGAVLALLALSQPLTVLAQRAPAPATPAAPQNSPAQDEAQKLREMREETRRVSEYDRLRSDAMAAKKKTRDELQQKDQAALAQSRQLLDRLLQLPDILQLSAEGRALAEATLQPHRERVAAAWPALQEQAITRVSDASGKRKVDFEQAALDLSARAVNEAALWFADAQPHASDAVWIEALRRDGLCQGLAGDEPAARMAALIDALPAEQRASAWGNSDFQRLEGVGGFLRCLMPVRLTGGGSVTYSVWLKLDDDQLRHALHVWDEPAYAGLRLRGEVANAIKPWPGLLGEPARAEVRDQGTLPYLAAEEGTLLARVLHEEWDRDDVLSRIAHALPVTVRQRLTESWSIERTAGLAPRRGDDVMRFVGPGRTVQIESFGTPPDAGADDLIAELSEGLPARAEGRLSEEEGGVSRRAFWLTATVEGRSQHELYGYAAVPGDLLAVVCMYDDPADLAWAQGVWRSARPCQRVADA